MKKSFFLSALCLMNVALMAEDYELRTLTFEDADAQFAPYTLDYANRTIATWSDLVDDAQYNGTLTYTTGGVYTWCDEGNTLLTHRFTAPYWGGGHAISNFTNPGYSNDHLPANTAWYELQFATLHGGNNGSKNFCVHNGHVDDYNADYTSYQTIAFADGKARVIDHMYVTNICYTLNSLVHGDGFNPPATDTTTFHIVAIGQDANGNEISRTSFALYLGKDSVVTTWQKWDLSVLGEVVSVGFNLVGSADLYGDWGLNAPAYFAYDDVAVRFDKNETALPNLSTLQGEAGGELNSQKVLHNSQLLILRDGKTYNMMGQEL